MIYFLKAFEKNEDSDIEGISDTVRKYVPTARMTINLASELIYTLDEAYHTRFYNLLAEIEASVGRLGLQGYGISLTGMEEVFFQWVVH